MIRNSFDHKRIEKEAQELWAARSLSKTDLGGKNPYYLLVEFPYPSGDLHIGHWYAFALTDIYARYMRMKGNNVLFPIGFDAFGLPAENAAIRNKVDPRKWTYDNMDRMRRQIQSMGTTFDWSKEVVTCDPSYYKWTQWLFSKFYEHNLAYRAEAPVKWCPKDQTVLANEQVVDGACERCGTAVEEKRLTQWFMKITEYAERLLSDLEPLPWREEIKEAQRAWIGKSEGARLWFPVKDTDEKIEVFTTRPDTVFGATYVVLAPEHALVSSLPVKNKDEVKAYVEATKRKTELERSENKVKTGVLLEGVSALNPATKEEIPVYAADYVLASYGTGAVMAVPAHDERDHEFAKKYALSMRAVIVPQIGERASDGQYRRVGIAIVENAKKQVLVQTQVKKDSTFFCLPGGGIDEGETDEEGTLRETREETGYHDFGEIRSLGLAEANYWNPIRKLNRQALGACFVVRLNSEDRKEPELTEFEKDASFSHEWMKPKDALKLLEGPQASSGEDAFFLRRYLEGGDDFYGGDGILINSGDFTDRNNREAFSDIVEYVGGEKTTNYRIRDWLVSRQRYWGCPIPVVYDPDGKPHLIPEEHLPWLLPTDVDFTPKAAASKNGEISGAPLASSKELKERVTRIFGEGWTPEYDTLDTFVDSSWYYLRYLAPSDDEKFSDASLMKKWLPVNRYSGGSEHTTMHLLYARFFHKALFDLSLAPTPEPFDERFNRGIILGSDGAKMSKSKGNVANPDDFVGKYGSDAVRMYLAFIGPYNEPGSYPWNLDGVASMRKFLDRVYALRERVGSKPPSASLSTAYAKAAGKAGGDIERFKFNTAIAALMVLVREFEEAGEVPRDLYAGFLKLLAPLAPHLAEHLHAALPGEGSVHEASWPEVEAVVEDKVELVVQVNGRKKGSILLPPDAPESDAVDAAVQIPLVREALKNGRPERVIYVPGRIVNLVARS